MPASRRSMTEDLRHRPFENSTEEPHRLVMSKWQAEPEFFENCRAFYENSTSSVRQRLEGVADSPEEYVYLVNVWLTIVNFFGIDAPYRKEFVEQMKEIAIWIPVLAFRRSGLHIDGKICRFHHRDYTLKEMSVLFDRFFKAYGVLK